MIELLARRELALALLLLAMTSLVLPASSAHSYRDHARSSEVAVDRGIVQDTSYFPAKLETSRLARLPGANYTLFFVELALVSRYYVGVERVTRFGYKEYNFVVISLNGTAIYNDTLDRLPRESKHEPRYSVAFHGDVAVLYTENYFYYVHGLGTAQPTVIRQSLGESGVDLHLFLDKYAFLITRSEIYGLYSRSVLRGSRASSSRVLDGHFFNNTLYLITAEKFTATRDRTVSVNRVFVEAYRVDLQLSSIAFERSVPLGISLSLGKHVIGSSGSSLFFVSDIDRKVVKYDLASMNTTREISVGTSKVIAGFVVDEHVVVIHGDDVSKYIDVYNHELELIHREPAPRAVDLYERASKVEVLRGAEGKFFVVYANVTGKHYIFLTVDPKHGLLSFHEHDVERTNEAILDFKLICSGALILAYTASVRDGGTSNVYILTIDFRYAKRISDVDKLHSVIERPREAIIVYNRLGTAHLTRVKDVAVVVAIGTPAIISYTDYGKLTNVLHVLRTPSAFNIEAARLGIKCVPLRGYTGPIDLYEYVEVVFEGSRVYYLNTTEFSSSLTLVGRPATLMFRDHRTGYSFTIDYTGKQATYYLPPSKYSIRVFQGSHTLAELELRLDMNRSYTLNIDEVIANYRDKENFALKFVADNVLYILVAVVAAFTALLLVGMIKAKRS